MKKTIFILTLNFFLLQMYAQDNFAVIKDKDGYSNVREGDNKSKIVGKISKYQPFDCMDSEDVGAEQIENMLFITYKKYVKKRGDSYLQNDENTSKDGYIHKSRVQKLADLPLLKKNLDTPNKTVFKNDTMTVTFEFAPFEYKKHILKNNEGKTITQSTITQSTIAQSNTNYVDLASIDNETVWGTDGGIPRTEIKAITLAYKDIVLSLPASSLKNIFEPSVDSTKICLGTDNDVYIWMQNSDGAGSYHVIWVIVGGELKYRYVQLGFYV